VVIVVELLVLILPVEMNAQLGRVRSHKLHPVKNKLSQQKFVNAVNLILL